MLLLVGLGNPGKKYESTYHNAGALVLEKLMNDLEPEFDFSPLRETDLFRFRKGEGTGNSAGEEIILIWPNTYMNESGVAVRAALKYFKAGKEELIVIHDDSDLFLGDKKISESENMAGHHGLISIQKELGGGSFKRIRIGIRNPEEKERRKAEEFVLNRIPSGKKKILLPEKEDLSNLFLSLLKNKKS